MCYCIPIGETKEKRNYWLELLVSVLCVFSSFKKEEEIWKMNFFFRAQTFFLTTHFLFLSATLFLFITLWRCHSLTSLPVDTLIDDVTQIYLSHWNSTITCAQIITSLRIAPASLHSQLLLCIWSHKHSPTVHLMGLLAVDQNLLVNKPDGVWF